MARFEDLEFAEVDTLAFEVRITVQYLEGKSATDFLTQKDFDACNDLIRFAKR